MKLRDKLAPTVLEHKTMPDDTIAKAPDFPSLNEVLKRFYLDERVGERSEKTIDFYRQHFDSFIKTFPYLATQPFQNIRIEHLQQFLLSKGEHIYAKHAAYRSFRALYYFAMKRGIVQDNLIRQIKIPKLPKDTNIPIVKKEDFKKLLRTCGPTFLGYRDRAILVLLYDTGLRLSELTGMGFSSLDLNNMEVKVLGKGNKKRTVSFDDSVKVALFDYIKQHPQKDDVLWLTEEKRPIANKGIQEMLVRRSRAAGLERIHPHMFRHSCAVNLLSSGMDIDSIMKYLGQETITVLQGYLKSLKSQDASVLHRKYSPMRNLY